MILDDSTSIMSYVQIKDALLHALNPHAFRIMHYSFSHFPLRISHDFSFNVVSGTINYDFSSPLSV